jgi:DNA-binding FadR family transcriptional regulator
VLRARILSGEAPPDQALPTQDELMAEFDVSKAAIREACRILETEGLLNIRRGNVGGASVHVPTPTNVAYSLSLVLHARAVDLGDVRDTLAELEPVCAGLCAGRDDRDQTVLPALLAAHDRLEASLAAGDGSGAAIAAREWHEALARSCGLETMAVIAGALEDVWSSHVRAGLPDTRSRGLLPDPVMSRSVVEDHARINRLIAAGNVVGATKAAARHLHGEPRIHADGGDVARLDVRADVVRDQLFKR